MDTGPQIADHKDMPWCCRSALLLAALLVACKDGGPAATGPLLTTLFDPSAADDEDGSVDPDTGVTTGAGTGAGTGSAASTATSQGPGGDPSTTTASETTPTTAPETTQGPPGTDTGDLETGTTDPQTTGDPDAPRFCVGFCEVNADCYYQDGDSNPYHYRCEDNICKSRNLPCEYDGQCQSLTTGWPPCDEQMDCFLYGLTCVDIGGGHGFCAQEVGMNGCPSTHEIRKYPLIGGNDVVEVCAVIHTVCDVPTGRCVHLCLDDADCTKLDGNMRCNQQTGRCGCSSDVDCNGVSNTDTCYDGMCGCSSPDVCTALYFADAEPGCQPN